MTEAALAPNPVILTDRAAKKIGRVLAKQPQGTVLRIAVAGGSLGASNGMRSPRAIE